MAGVGAAGGATPFSLKETQAWLHEWIDNRTFLQTKAIRSACEQVLGLFDERLQKFVRRFGSDVDLKPFLTQGSQAIKIAMDADPHADFARSLQVLRPPVRYKLIDECRSKHCEGLNERFWSNLYEKELPSGGNHYAVAGDIVSMAPDSMLTPGSEDPLVAAPTRVPAPESV